MAARLRPGAKLAASVTDGELVFQIDGGGVVRTYVAPELGAFYLAQWRRVARATNITPKTTSEDIANKLLDIVEADNLALRAQIVELDRKVVTIEHAIDAAEREMDAVLYDLYGLTKDERELVESSKRSTS